MNISNRFCVLLFFCGLPCVGQQVAVIPDIAAAEADYRDANDAWLKNDPNMERDLFTADPEQMRRRIHKAASLRDDAMQKKEIYLKAEIQRLQTLRNRLGQAEAGAIPTAEERKSLAAQQAHTLDEQAKVEAQLRDVPEGNEYTAKRQVLDQERVHLINLQNIIAQRLHSLENIEQAQQAIRSASNGDSLPQKLDEIVKLWEQERASAVQQRAHWTQLYAAMEQAVTKSGPVAAAPRKGFAGGFAGTWIYHSRPGAWSGVGEPEKVTLELHQESNKLRGTYTARLAVQGGFHDVQLALAGERASGKSIKLHWTSLAPAGEGEMALKLGGDGRLRVERSQSADGFIPRGMEVLLPQ